MNPSDYELYDNEKTALKTCPFCGGKPELIYLDEDMEETDGYSQKDTLFAAVHCLGCHVMMIQMIEFQEESAEAVTRWNKRVRR